jgi:hypothetical protein
MCVPGFFSALCSFLVSAFVSDLMIDAVLSGGGDVEPTDQQ